MVKQSQTLKTNRSHGSANSNIAKAAANISQQVSPIHPCNVEGCTYVGGSQQSLSKHHGNEHSTIKKKRGRPQLKEKSLEELVEQREKRLEQKKAHYHKYDKAKRQEVMKKDRIIAHQLQNNPYNGVKLNHPVNCNGRKVRKFKNDIDQVLDQIVSQEFWTWLMKKQHLQPAVIQISLEILRENHFKELSELCVDAPYYSKGLWIEQLEQYWDDNRIGTEAWYPNFLITYIKPTNKEKNQEKEEQTVTVQCGEPWPKDIPLPDFGQINMRVLNKQILDLFPKSSVGTDRQRVIEKWLDRDKAYDSEEEPSELPCGYIENMYDNECTTTPKPQIPLEPNFAQEEIRKVTECPYLVVMSTPKRTAETKARFRKKFPHKYNPVQHSKEHIEAPECDIYPLESKLVNVSLSKEKCLSMSLGMEGDCVGRSDIEASDVTMEDQTKIHYLHQNEKAVISSQIAKDEGLKVTAPQSKSCTDVTTAESKVLTPDAASSTPNLTAQTQSCAYVTARESVDLTTVRSKAVKEKVAQSEIDEEFPDFFSLAVELDRKRWKGLDDLNYETFKSLWLKDVWQNAYMRKIKKEQIVRQSYAQYDLCVEVASFIACAQRENKNKPTRVEDLEGKDICNSMTKRKISNKQCWSNEIVRNTIKQLVELVPDFVFLPKINKGTCGKKYYVKLKQPQMQIYDVRRILQRELKLKKNDKELPQLQHNEKRTIMNILAMQDREANI